MLRKPNVVYVFADDLGRGLLSCYGQPHYRTPNIDRLMRESLSFDNAHGCHICAPARASLLCGIHDSHSGGWTFTRAGVYKDMARGDITMEQVYELIHNTGVESRADDLFLPQVFKRAGYYTGQIGKLEWGFATSGDEIKGHGWDYHYGYYDHAMCHGYYPPFMFENGSVVTIEGNTDPDCGQDQYAGYHKNGEDMRAGRARYSQDLFDEKIDAFLQQHRQEPFFLYHPTQLPHGELSIAEIDPQVADDQDLTLSEKIFASMVIRLDETVGRIVRKLDELGLKDDTILVFGSDNGHCNYYSIERTGYFCLYNAKGEYMDHYRVRYTSEACGDVFNGNDGRTGCKTSNFEGGTLVPLMYRWPGHIPANVTTHCLVANYDFMATMGDLLDVDVGEGKDGVSYLPLLLGNEGAFKGHNYIVFASARGPALVTRDGWKLRSHLTENYKFDTFGAYWEEMEGKVALELYYLPDDYREERDLSAQQPQLVRRLLSALVKECDGNLINGTPQAHFAFYGYDYRREIEEQRHEKS
ncbi:MAG: sulfatase-like hydrolase/transferase [Eubacteriales bacterium]|nr:sulfatase-like hydrolase/transferase [Eubacteriales bacterium]